jgi:hypothetical protein
MTLGGNIPGHARDIDLLVLTLMSTSPFSGSTISAGPTSNRPFSSKSHEALFPLTDIFPYLWNSLELGLSSFQYWYVCDWTWVLLRKLVVNKKIIRIGVDSKIQTSWNRSVEEVLYNISEVDFGFQSGVPCTWLARPYLSSPLKDDPM